MSNTVHELQVHYHFSADLRGFIIISTERLSWKTREVRPLIDSQRVRESIVRTCPHLYEYILH